MLTTEVTVDHQMPAWSRQLWKPSRYKFVRGGRGSSKSWTVARTLLLMGADHHERVLCTREVQASIKASVHKLLADQIVRMGLQSEYRVLETEIRGPHDTLFTFAGLSDITVDSSKSVEGVTKAWIEEGQTTTTRSWRTFAPSIRAENESGHASRKEASVDLGDAEIWCTYNPMLDTDETHQRAVVRPHPDTISLEVNWRDNPWWSKVLDDERRHDLATMSEAEYLHVWEGVCMPAVQGAIYADEVARASKAGQWRIFALDPLLKLHVVWDLGWNDSMVLMLCQRSGAGEVRVVDYIEDSGRTLASYVAEIRTKYPNVRWGSHFLPHDGFHGNVFTGKTSAETLQALGCDVQPVPSVTVEEGIKQVRLLFPRLFINTGVDSTNRLLECLKRYRRNVPTSTGEPGAPRHDEYSHGADCTRYVALSADLMSNEDWGGSINYFSLGYR